MDTGTTSIQVVFITVLAVMAASLQEGKASRILLLPGPGEGSHYTTISAIGEELHRRGHNVTILISNMYEHRVPAKHREMFDVEVYLSMHTLDAFEYWLYQVAAAGLRGEIMNPNVSSSEALTFQVEECESVVRDNVLVDILREKKFDVMIGDMIYICPAIIAEVLSVKYIALTASTIAPVMARLYNVPNNPAYVPEMILL
ncbi:UDP-glucuronosyltransferase 1A3-like [Glandiceps talaboti]